MGGLLDAHRLQQFVQAMRVNGRLYGGPRFSDMSLPFVVALLDLKSAPDKLKYVGCPIARGALPTDNHEFVDIRVAFEKNLHEFGWGGRVSFFNVGPTKCQRHLLGT
tara:strand:- start:4893 stop:5213 length:321 start_codon:yes stop_codon:yes gene_type:complete